MEVVGQSRASAMHQLLQAAEVLDDVIRHGADTDGGSNATPLPALAQAAEASACLEAYYSLATQRCSYALRISAMTDIIDLKELRERRLERRTGCEGLNPDFSVDMNDERNLLYLTSIEDLARSMADAV